jgi:hypothetical protein
VQHDITARKMGGDDVTCSYDETEKKLEYWSHAEVGIRINTREQQIVRDCET